MFLALATLMKINLYQDYSEQFFNLQKSQLFVGKVSARKANVIAGFLSIS